MNIEAFKDSTAQQPHLPILPILPFRNPTSPPWRRLPFKPLHPLRNRHQRTRRPNMRSTSPHIPINTLKNPSLDRNKSALLVPRHHTQIHDPRPAPLAEVAALRAARARVAVGVRADQVVFVRVGGGAARRGGRGLRYQVEVGEDGGDAECGGGLATAF